MKLSWLSSHYYLARTAALGIYTVYALSLYMRRKRLREKQ
jgi:hypothetical protein